MPAKPTRPDVAELREIARLCREAEGRDRALDVRIWAQIGWTQSGDADHAWRQHLPMAPHLIVNGRTMAQAIELYPADTGGICHSWNVPWLTKREDCALALAGAPERPLVTNSLTDFGGLRRCRVTDGDRISVQSDAATLALAICSAALEACASLVEAGRPLPEGRDFDPRFEP